MHQPCYTKPSMWYSKLEVRILLFVYMFFVWSQEFASRWQNPLPRLIIIILWTFYESNEILIFGVQLGWRRIEMRGRIARMHGGILTSNSLMSKSHTIHKLFFSCALPCVYLRHPIKWPRAQTNLEGSTLLTWFILVFYFL